MLTPVTDAIQFVRRNPGIFFAEKKPTPLGCVQYLVMEAMALGATEVQVKRCGDWWSVSSPHDWFDGLSVEDAFTKLIPLPQAAANTCRAEVVINAFAESVVTSNSTKQRTVVSGHEPPPHVWQILFVDDCRIVAFRFDTE